MLPSFFFKERENMKNIIKLISVSLISVIVSFPNPRSCDNLKTPLDALAEENVTNRDIKETDINFIMFFIFSLSLKNGKLTI